MAKTAKLKTAQKPSIHSRANRRAPSPSPLDKTPVSTTDYKPSKATPSILSANPSGGIHKSKKTKPLKRTQRLRIEKGKERAENVAEQILEKVRGSERKTLGKKGRRAGWAELNEGIEREVPLSKSKARKMKLAGGVGVRVEGGEVVGKEEGGQEGGDGWEDVEDEEEVAAPMPGDEGEGEDEAMMGGVEGNNGTNGTEEQEMILPE